MKKIDMHHHLIEETGYVDNLLRTMDRFEIEQTALIGLGPLFAKMFVKGRYDGSCADDAAVEKVVKKNPDRFFGLGYIRLGVDTEKKVDELHNRGFKGLKFHIPKDRYDAEKFFPVYEQAQYYGMPCLFHTGIVKVPTPCPAERISSFNMSCIHLEAVAQVFPELKIIIAHLGVQDYLTALTMVRLFENIYADLSGTTPGWRANIAVNDWKRLLWFPEAPKKLLFGTDVHFSEIESNIKIYNEIADATGWNNMMKQDFYCNNSRKLFQLSQSFCKKDRVYPERKSPVTACKQKLALDIVN
jgi:predicted TIM-barrel fold metal-dependent hydrolase